MDWELVTKLLIGIVPAVLTLIGTLAGVRVQLKNQEAKAEESRRQIEKERERKEQERQERQEEGIRSLLRTELLNMYFKHVENENKILTQWEAENLHKMYAAYKNLDGNSFVKDLVDRMNSWDVVKN